MRADDEGFINSPKKIQRAIGCTDDDLRLLIAKSFVIPFESGIIVIKHWRIHNTLRKDRTKPTAYNTEKSMLSIEENGAYFLCDSQMSTTCQPNDNQVAAKCPHRLDKNRLDEIESEHDSSAPTHSKPAFHKHGEYKHIKLTDEQYSKLISDFGEPKTSEYIKRCENQPTIQGLSYDFNDTEYKQKQCDTYNETIGKLNETDGYNCDMCKNKGHSWVVVDNEILSRECEKCSLIRKSLNNLRKSGLNNLTFKNYIPKENWQRQLISLAQDYVKNTKDEWFFIGGQSGSGKTHICTATLRSLIMRYNIHAELFKWVEQGRTLKRLVNDETEYSKMIDKYKTAKALYIDDLFKVKKGEHPTNADVNLAFELIDYRYCNHLLTIISSEFSINDIIGIDESVGGRIKQSAENYVVYFKSDENKNYRLKHY